MNAEGVREACWLALAEFGTDREDGEWGERPGGATELSVEVMPRHLRLWKFTFGHLVWGARASCTQQTEPLPPLGRRSRHSALVFAAVVLGGDVSQRVSLVGLSTGRGRLRNTTKIVLKTIFELRWQPVALCIGQVIYDPNGEYATENAQDAGER